MRGNCLIYQGEGGAIPAGKVPPVTLAYRTSTVTSVRKAYSHYPKVGSVIALDPKLDQQELTRTVRRPTQDHIYCTTGRTLSKKLHAMFKSERRGWMSSGMNGEPLSSVRARHSRLLVPPPTTFRHRKTSIPNTDAGEHLSSMMTQVRVRRRFLPRKISTPLGGG